MSEHPWFKGMVDDTDYPYMPEDVAETLENVILESEAPTSFIFQGTRDYVPRKMPSAKDIHRHWGKTLVRLNKFESLNEMAVYGFRICWRCGWRKQSSLHRAHILARVEGGSDEPSNFHMLCAVDHQASELLHGQEYWDWFMSRLHYQDIRWAERHAPDLVERMQKVLELEKSLELAA